MLAELLAVTWVACIVKHPVKVSVFYLSSLRNEVKKLFYVQFFTNLIPFSHLTLTLSKCTSFAVFVRKITILLDKK